MSTDETQPAFDTLGLADPLLKAVKQLGYETPSPIQAQCIPLLMQGRDLVGQAQTGTGKTAAFALPLLSRLDVKSSVTQMLILAPTRELAIQVAEACQTYAKYLPNFHVLPIYGGQSYSTQLRHLKRGVQVVVGTPGRIMDHMRRGTLKLDQLKALVLDEADEMLRMGFIDDVEWILEHTADDCQIALFSATMPKVIRKVANKYLTNPQEVSIAAKTATASTINQRYLAVNHAQKMDAFTRILEVEEFDGVIVFVRTKVATQEIADKLSARGFAAEALNGDVQQSRREKIVTDFKSGKLDILVATDVAARGLDVERVSHVVNYDIPLDTEAYVHRIGRTGRAGRSGEAILFVTPRERRLLRAIENATKHTIDRMSLPGTADINKTRVARFKQRISDTLANDDLSFYQQMISEFQLENEVDPANIAAALASLVQGSQPLLVTDLPEHSKSEPRRERKDSRDDKRRDRKDSGGERGRGRTFETKEVDPNPLPLKNFPDIRMQRYRVEVGHNHGVKPGNLVGAIANEADIDACYIGSIEIHEGFSTVDLPSDMPTEVMDSLRNAWVCKQQLKLQPLTKGGKDDAPHKKKKKKKKPATAGPKKDEG